MPAQSGWSLRSLKVGTQPGTLLHDHTGNYNAAFWIALAFSIVSRGDAADEAVVAS